MRIKHDEAILLEAIVRNIYGCERGGMGGYIDADHFEGQPFDAALIALAPLWQRCEPHELDDFLFEWECAFRSGTEDDVDVNEFIQQLGTIVDSLAER